MLLTSEQIDLFKQAIKDRRISVGVFDLETSPSLFYGFSLGKQYVGHTQVKEGTETKIITAQYKSSLVDKKSKYLVWDFKNGKGDDTKLVKEFVKILSQYDILIGQNIRSFDVKVLQERAKALRLDPVEIDITLDTLVHSRSSFRALSHRLDFKSKQYGLGGKVRMDMADWIDIMEGRTRPEDKMVPYGLKDNDDTETVFWNDLPYLNLPRSTINKILKMIVGMDEKKGKEPKPFCEVCRKGHRPAFDVKVTKKGLQCQNCKRRWEP
jgi:hypothetical protein